MQKTPQPKLPPFPQLYPALLEEWDYEKNAGIDPHSITAGSPKKFFWKCKRNPLHIWEGILCNRTRKNEGCPYCTGQRTIPSESVAILCPKLMEEWHPTKNAHLDPTAIPLGSQKRAWWRCKEGHEWTTMIFVRAKKDKGCPECRGFIASEKNSLATLFPEIASEWHPTKNAPLTPRGVTAKSGKVVWWKCGRCLYEWRTNVKNRTHNRTLCPRCALEEGVIKTKAGKAEKLDDLSPNYAYDADEGLHLESRGMHNMFTQHLRIESETKSIESLFSPRTVNKIDYRPYYQRNYVWDKNKATYFIESILLGTEIPPLIFYESPSGVEVIDGRQRFETIQRFLGNEISLTTEGLYVLKPLAKKTYSELDDWLRELFCDTKIRIIKLAVVDESRFNPHQMDMLKKEVFRRYNSGITPLRGFEVEKAIYIRDEPTNYLKKQFEKNQFLFATAVSLFLRDGDRQRLDEQNTMEKLLRELRFLLVCAEMPLVATRNKNTLAQLYDRFSEGVEDARAVYDDFLTKLRILEKLREYFRSKQTEAYWFWWESLYWGLSVLIKEKVDVSIFASPELMEDLRCCYEAKATTFTPRESQFFYTDFMARYRTVAGFLESKFSVSFNLYIANPRSSRASLPEDQSEAITVTDPRLLRIDKQEAMPLTIDDICRMMLKGKFIVRPAYQRGEVINRTKSSAIIESILLGIKLPPLYIFKRDDGISEVVDGQQRLLSILGYIGQPFRDENGNEIKSEKHEYALGNLRILSDLTGKKFSELSETLKNKIYDFSLSLITIDQKFNPNFVPVDLFIRLNNRPYPIKENTFEMWNSYADKEIIDEIKALTARYGEWFYVTHNNLRMKDEELVTILSWLEFRLETDKPPTEDALVDIIQRETGVAVRLKEKAAVTRLLNEATLKKETKAKLCKGIKRLDSFIRRLKTILIDKDTDDEAAYVDAELTSLLNVDNKRYYARKFQDFYGLWYLAHPLPAETVNRDRIVLKKQLRELVKAMKKMETDVQKGQRSEKFMALARQFKSANTPDKRKIRLTDDEKKKLIEKQGNTCPLCNGPLFVTDEVHVDHAKALGRGGKDRFLNLQVTHAHCNLKKHTG